MDPAALLHRLRDQGITDERVLGAMARVPRELFLPMAASPAWADEPQPIGRGQVAPRPYVVAWMLERLALKGNEKVLEIGTGSGYQTAVLAKLCAQVYSVEIDADLLMRARKRIHALGCRNVESRVGDGMLGWWEAEPFDAIVGSTPVTMVQGTLIHQLRPGGRLVLPIGRPHARVVSIRKEFDGTPLVEASEEVEFLPQPAELPPVEQP